MGPEDSGNTYLNNVQIISETTLSLSRTEGIFSAKNFEGIWKILKRRQQTEEPLSERHLKCSEEMMNRGCSNLNRSKVRNKVLAINLR